MTIRGCLLKMSPMVPRHAAPIPSPPGTKGFGEPVESYKSGTEQESRVMGVGFADRASNPLRVPPPTPLLSSHSDTHQPLAKPSWSPSPLVAQADWTYHGKLVNRPRSRPSATSSDVIAFGRSCLVSSRGGWQVKAGRCVCGREEGEEEESGVVKMT